MAGTWPTKLYRRMKKNHEAREEARRAEEVAERERRIGFFFEF
jgi:hypothetical protein